MCWRGASSGCLLLALASAASAADCSLSSVAQQWQGQIQAGDGAQAMHTLTALLADRSRRYADAFTLSPIRQVLGDALHLSWQQAILELPPAVAPLCHLQHALSRFRAWRLPLDSGSATAFSCAAAPTAPGTPLMALKQALAAATAALAKAFATVDPADLATLRQATPELLSRFLEKNDWSTGKHPEIWLKVAKEVDFDALDAALQALATTVAYSQSLAQRDAFASARPIMHPDWLDPAIQGELLAAERTPDGVMLIGGSGDNVYVGSAAFILDLAGNDSYALDPGAALTAIVDLQGNDRYLGRGAGSSGAAIAGVSLLFDQQGNDTYAGGDLTQGSALLGYAALFDLQGDDVYLAQGLAQGAALFGLGLLFDGGGNDSYAAAKFSQGFGGPFGYGLLLERAGDEQYLAGGRYPSSYGIPGRFQAFAQGVGMGIPGVVSGGIGVLQDFAGDDRYVAANFAQGSGYYLGLGLLQDHLGDDEYVGARYAQGAAAHLGAGLLIERQGNERYSATIAAHGGGAWDIAVAGLIDCAGDDHYQGGDLAFGAGEQNGIGLFYDHAGLDHYQASVKALGFSGRTDYAGGRNAPNAGLFLDQGGAADHYHSPAPAANQRLLRRAPTAIFEDR
jgi:hypothetical protein